MTFLSHLFSKERTFFTKLTPDAQKLLLSILLNDLIAPISSIFINAFLWRQSQDLMLVSFYNIVAFAVVPLGFYLNGILLRSASAARLATIALMIGGGAITILMFLPKITYFEVLLFGIAQGISIGMYWGNRNLLTLKATASNNRIYFSSIETTINTLAKVIVPLALGWFITFGTIIHLYTPLQGYQMLVIYLVVITIAIGWVSKSISIKRQTITALFVKKVSAKWQKFRLLEFVLGVNDAARMFIPVLLVLTILGKEETLGTVQSFSAILATIMVYTGVKSLAVKHRLKLIIVGVLLTVIGGVSFGILYSKVGVLIFYACQALAWPFLWVAISSVNYDLIDEDNKDAKYHYAYVCDQEIYLNGGRVVGIGLFMVLATFASHDFALRFAPLLFAAAQIVLFFTMKSIDKNNKA